MRLKSGFKTDKGKQRDHNEDACLAMDQDRVYIVADGVGGNRAGELASTTAVSYIAEFIHANPLQQARDQETLRGLFNQCLHGVNEVIQQLGEEYPEYKGMATTLVICYIRGHQAYFVNVGDSRAYIYRGGTLFQITEDHSYVNSLVKLGVITRDEAKDHKKGNVITRAMGVGKEVEADFYETDLADQDILLLCSDGLYGEVKEQTIIHMIEICDGDMSALADHLVESANRAGGKDNISAVCILAEEKGDSSEQ